MSAVMPARCADFRGSELFFDFSYLRELIIASQRAFQIAKSKIDQESAWTPNERRERIIRCLPIAAGLAIALNRQLLRRPNLKSVKVDNAARLLKMAQEADKQRHITATKQNNRCRVDRHNLGATSAAADR